MFLSVLPEEQVELVVAEDGVIQEYYVEMLHQAKTKGNIYKGVINNIDANLQAAFVNYGAEKNGFLQIDEVHPEYYQAGYKLKKGQRFPPLQKVLRPGQEILVQVVKEPAGTKGAFLTSYLSLPGRYFVLTPGREQIGISRKIEEDSERDKLKEVVESLKLDEGIGVIVRTVSEGQSKTSLSRDLQILKRQWKEVRKKGKDAPSPSLIYQEVDLVTRAVRDYLTDEVSEVWIDDPETAEKASEYAKLVFPRRPKLVKTHDNPDVSLWERFNLIKQLDAIYGREVILPSGGRLVFDQTEALLAVDINTGRIAGRKDFREAALKTNMEAAEEIARQLRLRDVGGQVVIDFIEMKDRNHVREVEKSLKNAVKNDRARTDVSRMSRFGLLELVRQRMGSSALSISTEPCPCCNGSGHRRNMEWQSQQALKQILRRLRKDGSKEPVDFDCSNELALYLLNNKRERLLKLEREYEREILVRGE
jgi:ribonuclease E